MKTSDTDKSEASPVSGGYRFGTFKGVFTPSILTILGVIMFLRLGWVLGQVGLTRTLLIVTMASSVTLLTGLSLSALATNKKIGGGGAYYIISRSLGLEVGSAIGLPLYCAQALGIAFYIAGFSEALVWVFPMLDVRVTAVVTLVLLSLLAYFSADLALKTQFVVLGLIVASLVSFFSGGQLQPIETLAPVAEKLGFWAVFAVFFPAVTGIEVGICMSGDLKKPSRSLPLGTIAAVLVGFVIYMTIPVFMARWVPDHTLFLQDPLIMSKIARWGFLILLGVWAATLSSAMGALLGAPRTLQALARDRVIPQIIGRGFGRGGDPRIATAITFLIALVALLTGDLNVIAPVLSMFFLTSYGVLNISAGLEAMIGVPSWRPTFKIPYLLSLVGAFMCFAVMFMINSGATIIAALILTAVYYAIKSRRMRVQWGDARYGILMTTVQRVIAKLSEIKPSEAVWQPNILVFSGTPTTRWYLIELANVLSRSRGFITVANVLPEEDWTATRYEEAREAIASYLKKRGVNAFVKIVPCKEPLAGMREMIGSYGFGPIRPNIILLGETEKEENIDAFAGLLHSVHKSRRNVVIVRENKIENEDEAELQTGDRIDVWLRRGSYNRGLMCTLAYLMKQSPGWTDARLILKGVFNNEDEKEETRAWMQDYIETQRIDAEIELVPQLPEKSILDTIRASSQGASLALLGMPIDKDEDRIEIYEQCYREVLKNTEGFPPTAIVFSAENLDFDRIFDAERG